MGVEDRLQPHKAKLKKETNNNTFRCLKNPGIPEGHRSMTSHFNVINKCGKKLSKQVDVDYDKRKDSFKNPYKKNEETVTLRNEINCGGIGMFK